MTDENNVRQIYPYALMFTDSMSNYYRIVIWNEDIFGPARVIINTGSFATKEMAWHEAWKQIQQKMLKTLEG